MIDARKINFSPFFSEIPLMDYQVPGDSLTFKYFIDFYTNNHPPCTLDKWNTWNPFIVAF